jgi:hypothetical protein
VSPIEWYEISGAPSDQEKAAVLAALEQYVGEQLASPGPSWAEVPVTRSTPEPAHSWSGSGLWNGLAAEP